MSNVASSAEIFRRLIEADSGTLSPDVAQYFLTLDFRAEDHVRQQDLSEKARAGTLTLDERKELENYIEVDGLLSLMRLKAQRSLKREMAGKA